MLLGNKSGQNINPATEEGQSGEIIDSDTYENGRIVFGGAGTSTITLTTASQSIRLWVDTGGSAVHFSLSETADANDAALPTNVLHLKLDTSSAIRRIYLYAAGAANANWEAWNS